jgi:hypothetical protein
VRARGSRERELLERIDARERDVMRNFHPLCGHRLELF